MILLALQQPCMVGVAVSVNLWDERSFCQASPVDGDSLGQHQGALATTGHPEQGGEGTEPAVPGGTWKRFPRAGLPALTSSTCRLLWLGDETNLPGATDNPWVGLRSQWPGEGGSTQTTPRVLQKRWCRGRRRKRKELRLGLEHWIWGVLLKCQNLPYTYFPSITETTWCVPPWPEIPETVFHRIWRSGHRWL